MEPMDPQAAAAALAQELSAPGATLRPPDETKLRLFLKLRRVPAPSAAAYDELTRAFQTYMRANWRSEPAEPRQLELLSQHCIITPPQCTRGSASNLLAGLIKEQPFDPGYQHIFDERVVDQWLAQQASDTPVAQAPVSPQAVEAASQRRPARTLAFFVLLPIVIGAAGLLYGTLKRAAPQLQTMEIWERGGGTPNVPNAPPIKPATQKIDAEDPGDLRLVERDELLEEAVRQPADTVVKTQAEDLVDDLPEKPAAPSAPPRREAPGEAELDLTRKLNEEKFHQEKLAELRARAKALQQKLRDAYRTRASAEERLRRIETIIRVADSQIAQAAERQRQVSAMNPQPSNARQVIESAQAESFSANDRKNLAGRDLPGARETAASARNAELLIRTELGLVAAELARNRPPAPPAKVVSIYKLRDGEQIRAVYAVSSEGIVMIRDDAGTLRQIKESDVTAIENP